MDELLQWLRDRPYYEGQIAAHRTIPGRDPTYADLEVEPRLASVLADRGIDRLYRHQARAIEAIRDGKDVVVATPTASGKSLGYTVPAFEQAMDRGGRTLYIAPQNALINDQEETLSDLAEGLGFGSRVSVRRYTGGVDDAARREVRNRQPTVLLTNPDMLHYGILPHAHRLWDWFFKGLELVVLDEVHEYRGVFGSHVSLVMRRLARVCERFGADPQFVCCSATIGNPVEHAAAVTGRPESSFELVDEDESGTGPTHWLLWNPPEYRDEDRGSGRRRSRHVETMRLFADLVTKGHQSLVFAGARQVAERYATESAEMLQGRGHDDLAEAVTAYQAALKSSRREEIEDDLHDGTLRGVWSTNALELGVDVGGLDAVLLDGYPGTRMATFQQAGRAGRGTDPSLVVLIAGEDQLDQYVMDNPADLFEDDPEEAAVNPENARLLPDHVRAAARENWLSLSDQSYFGDSYPRVVADLNQSGDLERQEAEDGLRWTYAGGGSPHHEMGLRTITDREVRLVDRRRSETIASLGFEDALRDAHPGAIYHHQGTTYEVTDLDLQRDVAELDPARVDFFTQVLHEKEITVEKDLESGELPAAPDAELRFAEVTMHKQITSFERRQVETGDAYTRESLDLPETSLETEALYFTVPPSLESELRAIGDFEGGIHAAEHAAISLFPLYVLCDRRDVGGLSTPYHGHTDASTIFIYDGHPGGVGLAHGGFERIEELLARAGRLIEDCDCDDGCPSCVQSPHCGNANEPLDKEVAVALLEALTPEET